MAPDGNSVELTSKEEGEEEQKEADQNPSEDKYEEEFLSCGMEEDILGPVEDTLCGLGKLRSRYLQRLARPVTYLFLSSVVALVQGMFYTYSNATLSTIEKRFSLPSKVSGFTTTGNDLVQLALSVHITYLAGKGHRPRWLAVGMLGATIGCVLAATPHFIFGEGDHVSSHDAQQSPKSILTAKNKNRGMLCDASNSSSSVSCNEESSQIGIEQYTVVTLLLAAQMLAGFASMLYYTIGYSYLDESVRKDRVPLFLAISGSLRILGPVCGYSMAALALGYWVNPNNTPNLSPDHPRWIGAWWIGYLFIGATLLLITWSLLLLPKTLPGARKRALKNLRAAAKKGKEYLQEFRKTMRPAKAKDGGAMWPSAQRILTNKVYVLIIINQIFFWFAFFGYITFKPKYLEHQFKMSAAKANQYIAGAATAATLVGWLGTGSALTFFRPRAKFVLSFMAFLSATNLILHLCMVNVSCKHDRIHGMDLVLQTRDTVSLQIPSTASSSGINDKNKFSSECSSKCKCSFRFSPVCVDGVDIFYNPCMAGCSLSYKQNKTQIYENCSCSGREKKASVFMNSSTALESIDSSIQGRNHGFSEQPNDTVSEGLAVDGYCYHNCSAFYMYLTLTVLTKMTHAASRVPVNLILLRCVEERDKDMGLGIFNAALALFSSIPAPIIFGWAIDYSCQLWQNKCGKQGFCWLYDLNSFRYILHGIPAALMAGCLITEIILLSLHKTIHFYGKDENENLSQEQRPEEKQTLKDSECMEMKTEDC
ncbi:solute carrier organic anion transporter family member 74D-like [Palaemon carinicauda]|uniref:solute carrier organic anion transporter family member 74D-like n=1 Tax=Palaemon carinicauda TaxID=392227 RepID=UPI0035B5EE40